MYELDSLAFAMLFSILISKPQRTTRSEMKAEKMREIVDFTDALTK